VSVTRGEVRRIAGLGRLVLTQEEEGRLTDEMNRILEHVEALGRVDVTGVEGTEGLFQEGTPFRRAGAGPDPLQGHPSGFAPDWREGFFVVPRLPAVSGMDGEEGE